MNETTLRLSVTNCRAIQTADISLDGITVLAGVNSSGKSTVSHLFHSLVFMSDKFANAAKRQIWSKSFAGIARGLMQLKSHIDESKKFENRSFRPWIRRRMDCEKNLDFWDFEQVIDSFMTDCEKIVSLAEDHGSDPRIQSAIEAFLRTLRSDEPEQLAFSEVVPMVKELSAKSLEEYHDMLRSRSYESIRSQFPLYDQLISDADIVSFYEGSNLLFLSSRAKGSFSTRSLQSVFSAKDVCYIESPLVDMPTILNDGAIGFSNDASTRLERNDAFRKDESLFEFLSGTIAWGDPDGSDSDSDEDRGWFFSRKDGKQFPLEFCATGIRSLSTLNILYSNGCLNSQTVLILDEPEVHLHPQWIVHYAEILSVLAKRLGVRILIASHSPYMIRALREFGLRNLGPERIRFYLAEPDRAIPFKFNFSDLGTGIAPIFKAFNVALDQIAVYGEPR